MKKRLPILVLGIAVGLIPCYFLSRSHRAKEGTWQSALAAKDTKIGELEAQNHDLAVQKEEISKKATALTEQRAGTLSGVLDELEKEPNPDKKAVMISRLGKFGRESVPVLQRFSESGPSAQRTAALRVLSQVGSQEDIAFLLDLFLKVQDVQVQGALLNALGSIQRRLRKASLEGQTVFFRTHSMPIRRLLHSQYRSDAASVLASFGDLEGASLIVQQILDPNLRDPVQRSACVEALGFYADIALTEKETAFFREKAVKPLREALLSEKVSPLLKQSAAEALGVLGSHAGKDERDLLSKMALGGTTDAEKKLWPTEVRAVAVRACGTLLRQDGNDLMKQIHEGAGQDALVRTAALKEFCRNATQADFPFFSALWKSLDEDGRNRLLDEISTTKNPNHPALLRHHGLNPGETPHIRLHAAQVMGEMKEKEAVKGLVDLIDPEKKIPLDVVEEAISRLTEWTERPAPPPEDLRDEVRRREIHAGWIGWWEKNQRTFRFK